MISLFDPCALSADDVPMGYSKHTTSMKIECVRRYFSDPDISIRRLAEEKGVSFSTLSHWIKTARKAGLLNPGEALPAMVEVALPADQPAPPPGPDPSAAVTITIGKATVTLPPSMLAQALEALLRQ